MNALRALLLLLIAAPLLAGAAPRSALEETARREGVLQVDSTTDREQVAPLLAAFHQRHPYLRVDYRDLSGADIYRRALRGEHGDVLWSSAMDLQIKLVNEGLALRYSSPQKAALPGWASWRDEVYGTTFEPIVLAYDRHRIADGDMPDSHAALRRALRQDGARWRLASYDVASSGAGYFFFSQDSRHNPEFWDLAAALGRHMRYQDGNSLTLLQRLQRGEADIAYNVLGPYAWRFARQHPQVGWLLPQDYTLVVSRLQLIHKAARHPAAARLWMDFVLSREGQQVLAQASGLPPIRNDLPRRLGNVDLDREAPKLRPIQVGSGLLVYLDSAKRSLFLRHWQQQLAPGRAP
ncbi:ABC transporter substrate-binding protein [Vogesella sp. LIG4]|uniref:ABC transporter substrate-binding protein n=1 Tax=Vogesella sp. LIG4 TaxID=1192162 RepID=UPI00081FDEC1|nr:ABC transporter substrate-binding protein [Vogesella sp. LIG4]SCK12427.1 iron(III) transport system substrate-binding protein [Vogesella sp. LIG4]